MSQYNIAKLHVYVILMLHTKTLVPSLYVKLYTHTHIHTHTHTHTHTERERERESM